MFCTECGQQNHEQVSFCFACGAKIAAPAFVGNDGRPIFVEHRQPTAPHSAMSPSTSPLPRWRGASLTEVERIKKLSSSDWTRIADEFKEWHRKNSLTNWGAKVAFNAAWDNYYAGYGDGFEAGVNRALGITEAELSDIAEIDLECERSEPRARPATETRESVAYGFGKTIGLLLTLAGIGGFLMLGTGQLTPENPLPNLINVSLLTAFGVATFRRRPAAIWLGWAYLALLVLMTVAHGFTPLEIAQCLAFVWFVLHLRKQRTS